MQSFPQCTGWIRVFTVFVRCKQCMRFFSACRLLFKHREELRVIYDANFKEDSMRRRAFIVRSHEIPNGSAPSWIRDELHAMSSERNTLKCKVHPDAWHDTRADMNPVATFMQDQPHYYVARYNTSLLPWHPAMYTQCPM